MLRSTWGFSKVPLQKSLPGWRRITLLQN